MRIMLIAVALAASACTPVEMRNRGPAPETAAAAACNVDVLGDLVGKRASDARAEVMQARSGARMLRWIAPDTAVTQDFRPDRLSTLR